MAADAIRAALAIDWASTAHERTVDITTTGRWSGRLRRLEIWFYRHRERIYLSGLPGERDWVSNLQANPGLTFHLKHGVVADLPAHAHVVTDPAERHRIFTDFVNDLNQAHNPARIGQPTQVEDWLAGSPLFEVTFDDHGLNSAAPNSEDF